MGDVLELRSPVPFAEGQCFVAWVFGLLFQCRALEWIDFHDDLVES